MQSVYRDECMDVSIVRHGVQQFKQEGCRTRCFQEKEKYFFKDRIENFVEYWQKCIEGRGDYVEQ